MEKETAGRCGSVDIIRQALEMIAFLLQITNKFNHTLYISSQPIKFPNNENILFSKMRIGIGKPLTFHLTTGCLIRENLRTPGRY
jgi:hypothetical protein